MFRSIFSHDRVHGVDLWIECSSMTDSSLTGKEEGEGEGEEEEEEEEEA